MNQDARATFNVALINPAEIIEEIFSLARDYNLQAFFPEIHIHAMTKHGLDKGHISRLNAAGIKTYSDHRTLLEDNPQIDTIILLSNDPRLHHELHSEHSDDEITIIDYRAAKFMWEIIVQERLCLSCQTHLSHAQNLLRAILDEVREDILLLDLDKNIVDVNKNVYSRLGKTKDELIGRKCWETWSPNGEVCGTESYPCPFDTVIKTGQKAEALHTRVDKEGRLSYFRIYIYPIRNTQDKITHLVEMRRDITSRTYMEKKLQQSEKLVAIGELSTYIAHEIRNPLFAIGGFANSLLRMSSLESEAKQKARIILDESKRLDGILKSILNFARPTEAETTEVDVNEIVRQTMELMGIGCRKQGIEVHLDLEENLAQAKANPELVKQSLINVVKNAMEVMPNGGILDINTTICKQWVCIRITDSGPGIEPEIQEKIFNPFFSTKEKGSGLGLAMTKKTLEDLGGAVELKSKKGEGTTVTISLPPALAVQGQDTQNINI